MEPLTRLDASLPAIVSRWVGEWLTIYHGASQWLVEPLTVAVTADGRLATWNGTSYTQHQDRAALVEYVTTWARNTNTKG